MIRTRAIHFVGKDSKRWVKGLLVRFVHGLSRRKARWRERLGLGPSRAARLQFLRDEVGALRAELREASRASRESVESIRNEFAQQISFLTHDLGEEIAALKQRVEPSLHDQLRHLETAIQSRLNEIHTLTYEAQNRLIHVETSLHSRMNEVINEHFPGVLEQIHAVGALGQRLASGGPQPRSIPRDGTRPANPRVEAFDSLLDRARRDFPSVFDAWLERLEAVRAEFAVTKVGNVAYAADIYSQFFRGFVERYANGAVLDVGCGPFGKPYYLSGYPSELIAGLEPLPAAPGSEIPLTRGISEYLPWPDRSFQTVISATSLDHCISLDRSIDEMIRVLQSGGRVLLWIGSNPGAAPYRPLDPNFTPADRFHLFHFDIAWFEPMLEARFAIVDRVKLDKAGYSHVFYCLEPTSTDKGTG